MKHIPFTALAALLGLSTARAHDDGLTCHDHPPTWNLPHVLVTSYAVIGAAQYSPETGELALADIAPSGRVTWTVLQLPVMEPDAMRSADLDHDGAREVILVSRNQGRMIVVAGTSNRQGTPAITEYRIGPGPLGAEPVQREGASGQLVVPRVGWNPATGTSLAEAALFSTATREFLQPVALGAEAARARFSTTASVSPVGTDPNWYAVTSSGDHSAAACSTGSDPIAEFFTVESTAAGLPGLHKFSNVTLKRGVVNSTGGHFTGFNEIPWFAFLNPEDPVVEVAQPGRAESILHTFADPVAAMSPITRGDRDAVLIRFDEAVRGSRDGIYEFDPATGFTLMEEIIPPSGDSFADLMALDDGRIFASLRGTGTPGEVNYAVYRDDGNGFTLLSSGSNLLFSDYPAVTTVKLYTEDPFGSGGFEFEDFSAGHWASNASYDGSKISATSEVYGGSTAGLGNPMPVQLTPTGDPGPDGKVLSGQWGDSSSSLFFTGVPGAGGGAAVSISPSPGIYQTALPITFQAAPGTVVAYRRSGDSWLAAPAGGFAIASDTVIEFYGQAADGSLSPIQSAAYQIDLSLTTNPNGEWMPPQIASEFGLGPDDDPDLDDDGFSNLTELLEGTNPRSPNSFPSEVEFVFPPPLEVEVHASLPDGAGGSIPVAPGSLAQLMTFEGTILGTATIGADGTAEIVIPDFYESRPDRRQSDLFREDSVAPLLVMLTLASSSPPGDLTTHQLAGTIQVPRLPPPPAPPGVGPYLDADQWIADARDAYRWMRTNHTRTSTELTPQSTLATLAAGSWAAKYLVTLGELRPDLPWERSGGTGKTLSANLLGKMSQPQGPAHQAYRLGELASRMQQTLANDVAMEDLVLATEQIYLEAQRDPGLPNPLQALASFIQTGSIPPDYDPAVTPETNTLVITYTGLENTPNPRPVFDLIGTLVPTDRGWAIQISLGRLYPLLSSTPLLEVSSGVVRLTRAAYRPGSNTLPGSTVRVIGFSPEAGSGGRGDGGGLEVISLEFLEADLSTGAIDLDGDGVEDAFENLFLGTTEFAFWDDSDGDGFSLGEEYLAGTDPGNPFSIPAGEPAFPRDVIVTQAPDGSVTMSWLGNSIADYEVQISTTLDAWQASPVAPVQVGPGEYEWSIPAPDPLPARRFFQVGVSIN